MIGKEGGGGWVQFFTNQHTILGLFFFAVGVLTLNLANARETQGCTVLKLRPAEKSIGVRFLIY